MNQELQNVINKSAFGIVPGIFVYTKVSEYPVAGDHFLISKDNDEITVVTQAENLGTLALIERNKEDYALIALNVSVPFYSVGFLAAISGAIAAEQMNVLIVSTYSKDYILVKQSSIDKARDVLNSLGFKESSQIV